MTTEDDILNALRTETGRIDDALPVPPVPLTAMLRAGRAERRRRRAQLTGGTTLLVAAALVLLTVVGAAPWRQSLQPVEPAMRPPRLSALPVDVAVRQVQASVPVQGQPHRAWAVDDADGRTVYLVTRALVPAQPRPVNGVLRVYRSVGTAGALVAEQDNTDEAPLGAVTARGTTDCELDGGIDITQDSTRLVVLPRNRSGITVGWWRQCTGDVSPLHVSLSLLTRDGTYLVHGDGFLRQPPPDSQGLDLDRQPNQPVLRPTSAPAAEGWPPGTHASTLAAFQDLYN